MFVTQYVCSTELGHCSLKPFCNLSFCSNMSADDSIKKHVFQKSRGNTACLMHRTGALLKLFEFPRCGIQASSTSWDWFQPHGLSGFNSFRHSMHALQNLGTHLWSHSASCCTGANIAAYPHHQHFGAGRNHIHCVVDCHCSWAQRKGRATPRCHSVSARYSNLKHIIARQPLWIQPSLFFACICRGSCCWLYSAAVAQT